MCGVVSREQKIAMVNRKSLVASSIVLDPPFAIMAVYGGPAVAVAWYLWKAKPAR